MINDIDTVITVGAREYLKLEGEPYTDRQLAQLWAEQRLGEFGFRLLARFGVWGSEQMPEKKLKLALFKQYVTGTFSGIEAEYKNFASLYRNINMSFLFTDPNVKINPLGLLYGVPVALSPYVLLAFRRDNIPVSPDFFKKLTISVNAIPGFMDCFLECETDDYPLFARPLLWNVMGEVYKLQNEGLIGQIIESGINEAVWWPDIITKIKDVQIRMRLDAGQRVAKYKSKDKIYAADFFSVYAEDDYFFMLKECKERVVRQPELAQTAFADEGLLRAECILSSVICARSDDAITELFHVMDDAVNIANGRVGEEDFHA